MSFTDSLHDLLEKDDWNYETIRSVLERGSSSINTNNSHDCPPLKTVLLSKNCSVDAVKLLLQYGADVNCRDGCCGFSPLVTAIRSSGDEAVIQVLLEKDADVNQIHRYSFNETPLLILLKNVNCSIGTVKLLLRYKADVNYKDIYGYSPLAIALQNSRDESVISALLEGGAGLDTLTNFKRSPLCIAFEHTSNDIVKLLLDAGCSPNACKYHVSALHCATNYPKTGLREDILKRLINNPTDFNFIDIDGQSILCFALRNGAEAHDIKLLLNAGASLNTCTQHSSPLICATGGSNRTPLKAAVIRLLCNIRFDLDLHGLEILQSALKCCHYEMEAIHFLFELPGMNTHISDASLLHHAVYNPNCKVDVLKLLLKENNQLERVNEHKETPLHCAVKECKAIIVDFLLEKGSPVNAKNRFDETPLALAVMGGRGSKIVKSLFTAGAQLSEVKFRSEFWNGDPLKYIFRKYHPYTVDQQACLKTFVKYFFLQYPQSDLQDFVNSSCLESLSSQKNHDYSDYKVYASECWGERQIMKSMQVSHECTLHDVASGHCLPDRHFPSSDQGVKFYDLNQILRCLKENAFPVYFDTICTGVEKSVIDTELQKTLVYTYKFCPDLQNTKKVCFNSEIVLKIAGLLGNQDTMKFLLAYKPDRADNGLPSKDNTLEASTSAP